PQGRPVVRRGAPGLRLRRTADELAALAAAAMARSTSPDGRSVMRPAAVAGDLLGLAAIVIPRPDRDTTELVVRRLTGSQALVALLAFPRVLGWRDPGVLERHFEQLGWIAAEVPVFTVRVPWGPPFADDLPRNLLDAIGW
ncbi:MAG: hypothetical protein REI45_12510, partial [Propionicimonas sp.]|nr:hypothetical protein [Propionicimonas sp.]